MMTMGETMENTAPLSPMMQQYFDIKRRHKDHILFFRLGDFYEMFYDDAKLASRELELVLTGRDCGQEERAPMCGVPYHSCDSYIERLIKKGYKVAICEQMEDPKTAKGMVKREVVRVVTPGTLIESNMLDEGANNYIVSIFWGDGAFGLAFADISTGQVHVASIPEKNLAALKNELTRFSPSEVVFNAAFLSLSEMGVFLKDRLHCCAEVLEDTAFDAADALRSIAVQFGETTNETYGLSELPAVSRALGGLLCYLHETQKVGVERLISLEVTREERYMTLDSSARRNLELTQTMRSGERRGSVLWVLDKAKTAMGKRMLRRYLEQPLANPVMIEKRLNAVEELKTDSMRRLDLTEALGGIYDLERLLTRIVCGSTSPRELKSFEATLRRLPALKTRLEGVSARFLTEIARTIDPMEDLAQKLNETITDDPPVATKEGWFIRDGFSPELDELRRILTHTKEYLAQIEA
ncbi:MAG: DNA mismatch repair protein MutS, partial [Oscillospiraceae bacterium]